VIEPSKRGRSETVSWLGVEARYTHGELRELARLRASGDLAALRAIHRLKAEFHGARLVINRQ